MRNWQLNAIVNSDIDNVEIQFTIDHSRLTTHNPRTDLSFTYPFLLTGTFVPDFKIAT